MKTKRERKNLIPFTALIIGVLLQAACTHTAPFLRHTEDKPMQSYLAMNLPYERYQKLLQNVEKQEGVSLKSRGEAHITVITPIEFDNALKKHLSIEEIHQLAETSDIQKIDYKEVCIGRAEKVIEEKPEKTYFVVVQSPGLLQLRDKIHKKYIARGGSAADFNPAIFYPHITLGFTSRDLHFEDGIAKDATACAPNLSL